MADPVSTAVLDLLRERGETFATAESLTGGLVGDLVTGVPGASAAYLGGVITYATRLKAELAGVSQATLARCGPVAAETALEMAAGVASRCGADWGLSATGVAGPDEQDGHPVGRVYVAVARPGTGYRVVEELSLTGTRAEIRSAAARAALALLARALADQG